MSMTTFMTLKLLLMLLLLINYSVISYTTEEHVYNQLHKLKLENATKLVRDLREFVNQPNKNNVETKTVEEEKKISNYLNLKSMKRVKRQRATAASNSLMSYEDNGLLTHQQILLPTVPLPPPPPFPKTNFNISPFNTKKSSTGLDSQMFNAFNYRNQNHQHTPITTTTTYKCGGILKARHGVIQTPNFPHKFSTPIECVWIIDASDLMLPHAAAAGHNISIVVYFTQLYVLGGLKFTEYMYYSDDYKVPAHRVFTLTEDDVTQVAWVQFNSHYLEIRFRMSTLDGTHLRALDRLLDVYGFNMTYEVEPVKEYQCNTLQCRFLGHCYAKADFSSYYCSCFPGFSGIDCGRGPLCEDPHTNICQNGGTCKHIGDAAITCHCPSGVKGTKCEIPDISEITMGCTSNSSAMDCHKECDFDNGKEGGISLLKSSRTSARSGKTRYEVTIRLGANLTAFYRNIDGEQRAREQLPTFLEKHVSTLHI